MTAKKSKQWNVHLECSMSLIHFLRSPLMGSLESHIHCVCSLTLLGRGRQFVCTKPPAQQGPYRHVHTHGCVLMHAHIPLPY